MNILGFDTSTDLMSVIVTSEETFQQSVRKKGLMHSEVLLKETEHLLKALELSMSDIDLICCAQGPGSFTGLRIGVSTVKGLAAGSGKPFVLIPTLDLYGDSSISRSIPVFPVIDGKKKRFYTAAYKKGKRISEYLDIEQEDFSNMLKQYEAVLLSGPDALKCKTLWFKENDQVVVDSQAETGTGLALCKLAKKKYEEDGAAGDDTVPLYLRLSEAEINATPQR